MSPLAFPAGVSIERRFLMWIAAAYFDESDDNERAYSVAGFIGHQQDCVHLHWAWEERLLKKYGIDYFRASELEWGTGQFARFRDSPNQLDAKFSSREKELFRKIKTESIDIILDFDLIQGLGGVVMLPDYDRLFQEYKAMGKPFPAPYFFCANLVLMASGLVMNEVYEASRIRGLVRPVFDSTELYSGRAKQMFDEFIKKNPLCSESLLPPHYEDDKQYIALQAADNLAYESRRLLITQEYDTHIPERAAMKRLKERVLVIYKLDYAKMKLIMETQPSDIIPIKPEIENKLVF